MTAPCSIGFYIKLARLDFLFWATPEVILVFIYNAKFSYQFWGRKHYFSHEMSDSTWSRRNMIICNYIIWNCEFCTLLTKTKILKYKNQRQNITVYIWIFFLININIHSWSFVYLVLSICILHSMYGYCFDTKIYIYQIHVL